MREVVDDMCVCFVFVLLSLPLVRAQTVVAEDGPTVVEAEEAMRKAAAAFRERFVREGGFVRWSPPDPERPTSKPVRAPLDRTAPAALAFMFAYMATGDPFYLDFPREAAHALARSQLASGGWHHKMNDDPARMMTFYLRRDMEAGQTDRGKRTNHTVFDDDVSQSASRLLMLYDRATGFGDEEVHHASRYALTGFVELQYSSGGWPMWVQRSKEVPVVQARYPESWSREHPGEFYPPYYTINDAAIPGVIDALLTGYVVYGDRDYRESACRGGDFLLLAQMPDPQPAWCQQYTMEMTPAWARKFEPPSLVSYESISVIETLMKLYVATGDGKCRAAIAPALDWLERSRLPDSRFARFYELRTNRPIYFNTAYELVYTDDDLPTHYRFKWDIDVASLRKRYAGLDDARRAWLAKDADDEARLRWLLGWPGDAPAPEAVRAVIDAMNDQGAWDQEDRAPGRMFVANLRLLSSYIEGHQ